MNNSDRTRDVLERLASNMRPLIQHLAKVERKSRMCPICFCEFVLEAHGEDCAYADAHEALALLDALRPT